MKFLGVKDMFEPSVVLFEILYIYICSIYKSTEKNNRFGKTFHGAVNSINV